MSSKKTKGRMDSDAGLLLLAGAAVAAGIAYHKSRTPDNKAQDIKPDQASTAESIFPIRKGDKGEHVRQVQQALQRMGGMIKMYIDRSGGADGIYGAGTEKALVQAMLPRIITKSTYQQIITGEQTKPAGNIQDTVAVSKVSAPIFRSLKKNWMGFYEGDGKITTLPANTAVGRLVGSKVGNFILVETSINQRHYRFWIGEPQVDFLSESIYEGQFRTGKILKKSSAVVAAIVAFFK
jgi:hypothetical protein